MVLQRLFQPSAHRVAGQGLYQAATDQARQPVFYADLRVPDTIEGRFELYTLHVVLLLHRLREQGEEAGHVAQALFDAYVRALDDALREMGVGDLSVGKKMRKLGEAFYGRAKSYEKALAAADEGELDALIGRTLYADAPEAPRTTLIAYVRRAVAGLAETPLDAVIAARLTWPGIAA